jgi:hypothetical protein
MLHNFRASTIQLRDAPILVDTTPDGSCVVVASKSAAEQPYAQAFHVASFGRHSEGFPLNINGLDASSLTVGELIGQQDLALVSLHEGQIHTRSLIITSMENEYSIQRTHTPARFQQTVDHNLMHCLHEVWTRFPIMAPFDSVVNSRVESSRVGPAVVVVEL